MVHSSRWMVVIGLIMTVMLFAHTPLIFIDDNHDGTIYVEAGFSDGSSAAGMACRLEGPDGQILWEGFFDRLGSVTIEIPDIEEYYVVFDGGPGHVVRRSGPVRASSIPLEPDSVTDTIPTEPTDRNETTEAISMTTPSSLPVWLANQTASTLDTTAIKEELIRIQGWLIAILIVLVLIAFSIITMVCRRAPGSKSNCH